MRRYLVTIKKGCFFSCIVFLVMFLSVFVWQKDVFAEPAYQYGTPSGGRNSLLPCSSIAHIRSVWRNKEGGTAADGWDSDGPSYLNVPYPSSSGYKDSLGTLERDWLRRIYGVNGRYSGGSKYKNNNGTPGAMADSSFGSDEPRDELFAINFYGLTNNGKCNKNAELEDVNQVTLYVSHKGDSYGFRCITRGKGTSGRGGIDDKQTEVTYWKHQNGYDYFDVLLHPSNDDQQDLFGLVKVNAYVLTAQAIDTSTHAAISGVANVESKSVRASSPTAKVESRPGASLSTSTWKFVGWSTDINATSGSNVSSNEYSMNMCSGGCSDKIVYALYEKKQTEYKLTINQGDGTTIDVRRTKYTGPVVTGLSDKLSNGAKIYGGDKLSATMTVKENENYYWGTHSFVGNGINNTINTGITDHVVGADVTVTTTAVQKYRLYAKAVDITTGEEMTTNVTNADSGLVVKGNVATVSRPTVTGGYKFLGWYTAKTTDKSRLTGASDTTYKVSNISANTTVYAFYVKEWTLTKTQGTGTTITVTRSESLYGGGSTGTANLASGTTLYQGDKISATFGVDVGYSWGSHSFVGKDINNTANTTISNHIVGANVTVTTTASQNKYKLTAKAVDVTTKTLISGIADTISSEVTHNQEATVSRPTASGYKFLGWSTSANANKNALTNADKDSYSMTLTSNATVYAYYVKEWKLTISAGTGTTITVNRITSTYGGGKTGALASGAILYQGDVIGAVISKGDAYSWGTHSFVYWDANGNKQSDTTNTTISKHTVGSDVTVSAEAVENTFQGKVDAGTATTGWKDANNTQYYEIANCSPTDGCKVTFTHSLKRAGGKGKVSYTITRESNYSSVSSSDSLKTGTFNSNTASTVFTDSNLTLYPGQTVCETLIFEPRATSSNKATLKVCALALGKTQPDTPTDTSTTYNPGDNANAFINMHVKNTSNSKYNTYQKEVYAKPGDSLTYRAIYNPVLQYTYNLIPQQMRINGGTIYSGNGTALGTLFNSKKGSSLKNWNNAFSVNSAESSFTTLFNQNYTSNLGATTKQTKENEHAVLTSEVGKVLKETAKTNLNDNTKTTPSQIVFTRNGNNVLGNVITSSLESSAEAKVPYNFNTDVKITTDSGETLNAGETKVINYEIDILPKINSLTTNGTESEAYATMVRDAMSKVIIYTIKSGEGEKAGTVFDSSDLCSYYTNRDSCWYESEKKYDGKDNSYLNVEGNTLGQVYDKLQTSINVSDVDAGYKFCVAVALYPASSGSDDNLNASGSNTWRISNSKCFSVGKRPTFQVWGGSFYAANDVATSTTAKRSLNGLTMDGGLIVFSSWVENAVVSNGKVTGLASGAAAGLSNNAVKGGSLESSESYCKYRVPLSLANYARSQLLPLCSGTGDAGATGYSGIVASTNKESLTDPLPEEVSIVREYNDGAVVNFDTTDVEETTIRHMGNNLTINETTIATGKTHIVKAAGNITIAGNVYYNTASYTTLTQVPKLLIYAKGNITINCGVREIDAMIIAEGNVNTCNSGDINSEANSNPLVVNGAIITKSLTFNRTFGAGTGLYSKIPAEIVNYDTSIILWGRGKVNTEDYGAVYQVYQHELAPRY